MNELFFSPNARINSIRSFVKNVMWSATSHVALHGLCPLSIEDGWLKIEHLDMHLPGLGRTWQGATIAHVSDLHCSPLMREAQLLEYFQVINRLRPDFIVITGDFITAGTRKYAKRVGKLCATLRPNVASLAVLGNHDYGIWHPEARTQVKGLADYLTEQLDEAGVITLIDESHTFRQDGDVLHFAGAGELWSSRANPARAFEGLVPHPARGLGSSPPIIGLTHNPDAAMTLANLGARYVLCGHTHGRPSPDTAVNRLLFPVEQRQFIAGRYALPGGRFVYVNRGLGHARRVDKDSRPEITLFSLRGGKVRPSLVASPERQQPVGV